MTASTGGGVPFQASGRELTLRFGLNALCDLEEELKRPIAEIVAELESGSVRMATLRAVFWAGLQRCGNVTIEEAGDAMTEIGIARVNELVGEALNKAFVSEAPSRKPKAGKAR